MLESFKTDVSSVNSSSERVVLGRTLTTHAQIS